MLKPLFGALLMSLAVVMSRSLDGLSAPQVHVEVQLANGLPSFTLVGLADTEVKEARERVRAALQQSGFAFPHNQRITVNLAPAELPKESGRFDLPIALGILAAAGQLCTKRLAGYEFAGELSLAGELRPVRGALALALALQAAQQHGGPQRTLVLPADSARAAALVPGLDVRAARSLAQVVKALQPLPPELPADAHGESDLPRAQPWPAAPASAWPCLRDIKGQAGAKRALEIAAAGGHSLLLVGPPGTGKSMLAQRLPGVMPPLELAQALSSAALQGLNSAQVAAVPLGQRPLRAPHHTASAVALVGGGSPPRPGEISLAHGGVLFLDEMAEFPRAALEALREPLETGCITISRAARQATFPARFQLVAAMNPCPCGWLGAPAVIGRVCRCSPEAVARYQGKLSGPLLDRIDLQVEMFAAPAAELLAAADGEPSAVVAQRVAAAAAVQHTRQGYANALLSAADLDSQAVPEPAALALLRHAAQKLAWSGRRLHRSLKVARTIADLAGSETVTVAHMAEAVQLQRVLPG
jgi:magnesium chelatase family protein